MTSENNSRPPGDLTIEIAKFVSPQEMTKEVNEAYEKFGWGDEFVNHLNGIGYKVSINNTGNIPSTEGE